MQYYPDDSNDEDGVSARAFHSLGSYERASQRRRNRIRVLYSQDETGSSQDGQQTKDMELAGTTLCRDSNDPSSNTLPRQYFSFPDHLATNQGQHAHKSRSCSDMASLENAIENLYKNYTCCRQCHSNDIVPVEDPCGNNKVLLVVCQNCSHPFGFDDSMSPQVLLDLYRVGCIEVAIGCCTNTDPDQFEIEASDGDHYSVLCLNCNTITVLSEPDDAMQKPNSVTSGEECGTLVCKCGNQNQDDMEVCIFGEEMRCVMCKLCEQFIELPADRHDPSQFVACKCLPKNKKIVLEMDAEGEPEIIACGTCGYYYLPKDCKTKNADTNTKQPDQKQSWSTWLASGYNSWRQYLLQRKQQPAAEHTAQPKYREVCQISDLCRADHVMWDRHEGYGHHAIVENVHPDQSRITVVHYNGPSPSTHKVKGMVVSELLDPFAKGLGKMYVVDHTSPLPPEKVIEQAHSKLGEVEYCLLNNNCEHFATWCKTGQKISSQVIQVKACFSKYAKLGLSSKALKGGQSVKWFGRYGRIIGMAGQELSGCVHDITKATEDRKAGRISRDAYIEFVVSRTCRSLGGLGGLALGLRFPVPVYGATLGGVIGEYAGKQIGTLVVRGYDELGQAFIRNKTVKQ